MGSPTIFAGARTKALSSKGLILKDGTIIDNDGLKNYIKTNNFENGLTTGWSLGTATLTNNFPSGAPTFGSGASGNLAISIISSGQLAGTKSLSYASSAITTAGDFLASDAFTIDAEDQAKVLQFKFSYKAQTNPSNANWSGTTSNSFGVAIYDVTNSAWIQPAGCFNLVQSSGVGQASGTFQTSSNGTSYRLVIYNANATLGAVTVYFDSFFVGPQITAAGAAMSDWVSFTPTQLNTTNVSVNTGYWRRIGDSMQISGRSVWNGAGSGTAWTVQLPTGFTIDTNKVNNTSEETVLGNFEFKDSGVNFRVGNVVYKTNTTVSFVPDSFSQALLGSDFTNGDSLNYIFQVPIVGWSSNTVMSSDTDTRVVAVQAYRASSSQSISSASDVKIEFNSKSDDTHGAFDSTTNYRVTIPVSGTYQFHGIVILGASTGASAHSLVLYKNGSAYKNLGNTLASTSSTFAMPYSTLDTAKAGDYYELYLNTSGQTTPVLSNASVYGGSQLNIHRLSGPATIAASAVVSARLYKASNQSYADSADDKFLIDTVDIDTVGGFNAANNRYIIQTPGKYRIVGKIVWSAVNSTGFRSARIKINGTLVEVDTRGGPSSSWTTSTCATVVRNLIPGDYIELYGQHTAGTSVNAIGGATIASSFEIERLGGII